jgi:hypothetical protein
MAIPGCAPLLAHPPSSLVPSATSLVELAWRLVRFQPQYPPIQKRLAVLAPGAKATGGARKKATVARPSTGIPIPLRLLGSGAPIGRRSLALADWPMHPGQTRISNVKNPPANHPSPISPWNVVRARSPFDFAQGRL